MSTKGVPEDSVASGQPSVLEPATFSRTQLIARERAGYLVAELGKLVPELSWAVEEMARELSSTTDVLKAERLARATETIALDFLKKSLVKVESNVPLDEHDGADVLRSAGRELEKLEKQLRDVQGREALREAELRLEVEKATVEVEELRVSRAQMYLELQVKDTEIDELQKEARLHGNQLLELVETTTAVRSSRDEAMKERDIVLGRAQIAEEELLQANEHAR